MKRILIICALSAILSTMTASAEYEWAAEAVNYCVKNQILSGMENGDLALGDSITNEQTAKVLVDTFLKNQMGTAVPSDSIDTARWSAPYVNVFQNYTKSPLTSSNLTTLTTREEFVSSLVLSRGLNESNIRNSDILSANFSDYKNVDSKYNKLMCIAVERGYMKGSDGMLKPKDNITRAEACSLIYRVIREQNGEPLDLGVIPSYTELVAPAQVSVEQAKRWAESKGAEQIFIDIADYYWKYGELTGIRPEILYAQAAKETGYGHFGRHVLPEQNNWAGIKVANSSVDHETFATPEDGVRGHFNHICAYIGLAPVGEPHGRYYSVSKLSWAGTVKTLEELGGKWCPDLYYGYSILHNCIEPMMKY